MTIIQTVSSNCLQIVLTHFTLHMYSYDPLQCYVSRLFFTDRRNWHNGRFTGEAKKLQWKYQYDATNKISLVLYHSASTLD